MANTPGGVSMADPTDLEERVADLERHVRRLLLILSACGSMLSEIRRDDGEKDR
jgi:hypothetical protein